MSTPYDPIVAAWKQQVDAALGAVEAITEGARRIHEKQLEAACEAHACAEATRKRLAGASDPNELWRIQSDWLAANLQSSLAYWRGLCECVAETDTNVAKCLGSSAYAPAMPDELYKQWMETTRRIGEAWKPATAKT